MSYEIRCYKIWWENNPEAGEYVDLIEKGILDPAKVTRAAIENSASVGAMVLTTEALITDVKEDTPAMPPMGGGMPDMGM